MPHLAVTLGVLLAMLSLGVLIFFIHHVSMSIQASQIIANVAADLDSAVVDLFPDRLGHERTAVPTPAGVLPDDFDRDAPAVPSTANGYVQAIDGNALLELATERDVVLRIEAGPGRFVRDGTALVRVWPGATMDDSLGESVRDAFIIGSARTPTQDVQFFVEQLVELAVRALSPGINDPGTARMCLDRLGQTLGQIATRETPASCRYDDHGRLRVMADPVGFESMAATAFDEIRRYGRSSASVTIHLFDVIRDVAGSVTREPDRTALLKHAAAIMLDSGQAPLSEADRVLIQASHRDALAALHRDPA